MNGEECSGGCDTVPKDCATTTGLLVAGWWWQTGDASYEAVQTVEEDEGGG